MELIKDKMSPFDYKCALCEFSTSQVSGRIYYIRRRSGNIYFPCEMCQFVKITLQTATAAYMSSHTKKVVTSFLRIYTLVCIIMFVQI